MYYKIRYYFPLNSSKSRWSLETLEPRYESSDLDPKYARVRRLEEPLLLHRKSRDAEVMAVGEILEGGREYWVLLGIKGTDIIAGEKRHYEAVKQFKVSVHHVDGDIVTGEQICLHTGITTQFRTILKPGVGPYLNNSEGIVLKAEDLEVLNF
jgi:hypothetical protein